MEQGNVSLPTEYPQAVRSIRWAKNILWVLAVLCIVLQLAVFILVGVVGMTDAVHTPKEASTQGTYAQDAVTTVAEARFFENDVFRIVLSGTRFLVMVFVALLAMTLVLGVMVSLVGRLGGVAALLSAFFWTLLLLALLTPWQQIMQEFFSPGFLFGLDELVRWTGQVRSAWGAQDVGLWNIAVYYVRFAALPLITLAILALIQIKCVRGFRRMALQSVAANF